MVGGSSRIPAVQDVVKKLTGKEGFKGINPDECVAMGAALQGGVLVGDVKGDVYKRQNHFQTGGEIFNPDVAVPQEAIDAVQAQGEVTGGGKVYGQMCIRDRGDTWAVV